MIASSIIMTKTCNSVIIKLYDCHTPLSLSSNSLWWSNPSTVCNLCYLRPDNLRAPLIMKQWTSMSYWCAK